MLCLVKLLSVSDKLFCKPSLLGSFVPSSWFLANLTHQPSRPPTNCVPALAAPVLYASARPSHDRQYFPLLSVLAPARPPFIAADEDSFAPPQQPIESLMPAPARFDDCLILQLWPPLVDFRGSAQCSASAGPVNGTELQAPFCGPQNSSLFSSLLLSFSWVRRLLRSRCVPDACRPLFETPVSQRECFFAPCVIRGRLGRVRFHPSLFFARPRSLADGWFFPATTSTSLRLDVASLATRFSLPVSTPCAYRLFAFCGGPFRMPCGPSADRLGGPTSFFSRVSFSWAQRTDQ